MGKLSKSRRGQKKKEAADKKAAHEQMIKEANARHDAQFGSTPNIIQYYTEYVQGTGMRQSK